MQSVIPFITDLAGKLPTGEQIRELFPYLTVFAIGLLALGVLGRVILGKRSALNHSVSSAMAVLYVYVASIAIYAFHPWQLEQLLSPLPFVTFAGDKLVLFPFHGPSLPMICSQILPLLIICFLVNLLDTFLPQGKNVITWFLLRFVTIALAMVLHLAALWAFNTFLPEVLVRYAPMILLGVLASLLLIGLVNVALGLLLTAINPIFGAIYAFFFSNVIGKEITKAVFSTILLCIFFGVLEYLGFTVIAISQASLIGFLPIITLMLVLWYLLGHTL